MAHYAFIDDNGTVVNVIVGKDESSEFDWEQHYSEVTGLTCKRTSYNTNANTHPTKEPFRKNFASVAFTYNETLDGFIPPSPYPSWVLDETTCQWEAPVPYPEDNLYYLWDEETTSWVLNQAYYDSLNT